MQASRRTLTRHPAAAQAANNSYSLQNGSNKPNFFMKKIVIMMTIIVMGVSITSCKAWRTISTTSSYTQVSDSSKVTTTISTKTVEEYTGVKKN